MPPEVRTKRDPQPIATIRYDFTEPLSTCTWVQLLPESADLTISPAYVVASIYPCVVTASSAAASAGKSVLLQVSPSSVDFSRPHPPDANTTLSCPVANAERVQRKLAS